MSEIEELLRRVNRAMGPSRELDIALECALPNLSLGEHSHRPSSAKGMVTCNYPNGRSSTYVPRRFTLSIDDALSLVERAMPNASWSVRTTMEGLYAADVPFIKLKDMRPTPVTHRTAPLAMLSALLTALIAQEQP